ncbi:3-isopropylmalate dehydratase large subunit [bacterium]|nr:3-isopropylmalate dehydratase large subunit [bacterium]
MGQTFVQKILAAKAGLDHVEVGQIVEIVPDVALSHDNTAAISKKFETLGIEKIYDQNLHIIVLDHCVPAASEKYASNHKVIREFVKNQEIEKFYDINNGVCHQIVLEKGHIGPGMVGVGSDSHTTMYGAVGAFSTGIGRSEMAVIFGTGKIWFKVPPTIKFEITGEWPDNLTSKDLILHIIGDIGSDGAFYSSCEFTGPAISALNMSDRMVLSNMSVEMGAKNGYIPPDEKTLLWLSERTDKKFKAVYSDEDCKYSKVLKYDVSKIKPTVARPHTVDNCVTADELSDVKINQALIGTCTNGRVEDIEMAASVLKGKKIHPDVRLLVFPASMDIYKESIKLGYIEILIDAGAVIMNPGCGPCLGAHEGTLAPEEVCISTANRNFKGRMGCKEASVYLASPLTVATSALTGKITSP